MKIKVLGTCDFPNCNKDAIWECGQVTDKQIGKPRMGKWCDEHCPISKDLMRGTSWKQLEEKRE